MKGVPNFLLPNAEVLQVYRMKAHSQVTASSGAPLLRAVGFRTNFSSVGLTYSSTDVTPGMDFIFP